MSSGEQRPGAPLDIAEALRAAGIGTGPAERSKRLIRDTGANARVLEFFSSRVAGRMLAIGRRSNDGVLHDAFKANGLPVLPEYDAGVEDVRLLVVPLGTMPLSMFIRQASANLTEYGGILTTVLREIGRTQHVLHEAEGLGVMPVDGGSLIDRFAYAPSERRLFMVPPYDVDPREEPGQFVEAFTADVANMNLFSDHDLTGVRGLLLQEVGGGQS